MKNNYRKNKTHKKKYGGVGEMLEAPHAPMKPYRAISRLDEEEKRYMDEVEAYDVEPVDLENMEPVPLGDIHDEEYGRLSKMKGRIGGGKKMRKTRRNMRRMSKSKKINHRKTKGAKKNKRTTKRRIRKMRK